MYNLEQCFVDHTSELEAGYFVNPETQEIGKLTPLVRYLVMAMLLRFTGDPDEKDPHAIARNNRVQISAKWVSDSAGIPVRSDTYSKLVKQTTQAGIFDWQLEPLGNYSVSGGVTLRCEHFAHLGLCDPARHLPGWFKTSVKPSTPSVKPSTLSVNPIGQLGNQDDPALIRLDMNKLNKPNNREQTIKTGFEVSQVEEAKSQEPEKPLSPNWEGWTWIRARQRGLEKPSPMDIGYAWNTYQEFGSDLETDGNWTDGRPYPRPAHS